MKKFLSMVMAAAMVVSLVPATAFAATGDIKATAKVVDAATFTKETISEGGRIDSKGDNPEVQLTFTTVDTTKGGADAEFTFTLDNAKFGSEAPTIYVKDGSDVGELASAPYNSTLTALTGDITDISAAVTKEDDDEIKVRLKGDLTRGMVLAVKLGDTTIDKVSKNKTTTVTVDSDDATISNGDDLVYATVDAKGIKATVKKTVDVAAEEYATTEEIKIEPVVGNDFTFMSVGDEIKLKLNSGFEFVVDGDTRVNSDVLSNNSGYVYDDDEITFTLTSGMRSADVLKIKGLGVEAVSAKAGSTATIKVYAEGSDTVSVEVAKVVDYAVTMTVDEDEDVPVIYSGVNVDNKGITDDSDHMSLEVTIKESFPGAWNNSKDFTLTLPEGVYVVDADAKYDGVDGSNDGSKGPQKAVEQWFADAYDNGDFEKFDFKKRLWDETVPNSGDDEIEINFSLQLVADPNFEGDVTLKLEGDAVDTQEVTIAKFVKPFVVEAQQNDMQIDYRNTEIPTSVVIKEAEAGLWDKNTTFELSLDKIDFDDEGKIAVDKKSGLELKDDKVRTKANDDKQEVIYFTVDSRSDDEPATVTLSGIQLYMQRSLPAGAYDLKVVSPEMYDEYVKMQAQGQFGEKDSKGNEINTVADLNEDFVSHTAKAGFVNIVTAGREDTDSFTTKVVVPVGEKYIVSGENKVEIDVPAYINANGYTMLPLRAVAVALGINTNNVLWDQNTRTATIMYGSKIISMTYGQKVVYVNGAMIPATASVEIKDNRMFLGMRDLGNALGVTDITWDAATKTATLNGNK